MNDEDYINESPNMTDTQDFPAMVFCLNGTFSLKLLLIYKKQIYVITILKAGNYFPY